MLMPVVDMGITPRGSGTGLVETVPATVRVHGLDTKAAKMHTGNENPIVKSPVV